VLFHFDSKNLLSIFASLSEKIFEKRESWIIILGDAGLNATLVFISQELSLVFYQDFEGVLHEKLKCVCVIVELTDGFLL